MKSLLALLPCLMALLSAPALAQDPAQPTQPQAKPSAAPPSAPSTPAPPPAPTIEEAFSVLRNHAGALSSSTGALTGAVLLGTYISLTDADAALLAKAPGKDVDLQVVRHLATLSILEIQVKQLKETMKGQKGMQEFLEETQVCATLLKDLAKTVRDMASGKADRATGPYLKQREETRERLMRFIKFPDNRQLVP